MLQKEKPRSGGATSHAGSIQQSQRGRRWLGGRSLLRYRHLSVTSKATAVCSTPLIDPSFSAMPRTALGVAARGAQQDEVMLHVIRCALADHRPKLARSEPIEIVLAFLLPSLSRGLSRDCDTGRTSCDAFFVQSQRLHWLLA
jgi:hypothetical protein